MSCISDVAAWRRMPVVVCGPYVACIALLLRDELTLLCSRARLSPGT